MESNEEAMEAHQVQVVGTEVLNPTRSAEIKDLAAALAKAQGMIEGAKKDSDNPFFGSKYADLKSVWDVIRKPFADNGLSVIQRPYGESGIETLLLHSSGQWISGGKLEIKPKKDDAHGIGSAITYARRYTLMAIAGVAPEDDDGNAATGKSSETKKVDVKRPDGTEVKKPEATSDSDNIGKLKNSVLKSIDKLPKELQKDWKTKVAKAKTVEAVMKIDGEIGAELF